MKCYSVLEFLIFIISNDPTKYEQKIEAIGSLYKILFGIKYKTPDNEIEEFCLSCIQKDSLYTKLIYDYYNISVKYLSFKRIGLIKKCELLKRKDKIIMCLRFIMDKILK